ncbi:MAG: efflux family protein [Clostridia bacterium]|nr:efflux family protein [Clostridia bacterium]
MYKNKNIFKLLWPILIEQTLSAMVGITDTVMVSQVGGHAVSAVGLVDSLNILLMNLFVAVAAGSTVVISQLAGKGDKVNLRKSISQAIFLAVIVSSLIGIILLIFGSSAFSILFGRVEPLVKQNGLVYMSVTAFSFPFVAIFSTLSGALRGQSNSRTPMIASVVVNLINVTFNAIFIYGMGLGVFGAAIATLMGRIVGSVILIISIYKIEGKEVFKLKNFKLTKNILTPILKVGIPSGLDSLLFNGGKIIVQIFLSGMGTDAIAGNVIAGSLFGILCIPGNAFQLAVITVAGNCFGAGLHKEARYNTIKCNFFAMGFLAIISLILVSFVKPIVSIYNPSDGAMPYAVTLLYLYLVAIPLFWCYQHVAGKSIGGLVFWCLFKPRSIRYKLGHVS